MKTNIDVLYDELVSYEGFWGNEQTLGELEVYISKDDGMLYLIAVGGPDLARYELKDLYQ